MNQLIDQDLIDPVQARKIKYELYTLILQYCTIKKSHSNYRLYLHDSQPINYLKVEISEIDRFYDNVRNYCKGLDKIVSNLAFDAKTEDVESDRIIGSINIEKTRILRQQGSSNIICTVYSKNLFVPENILLGAILLGIRHLAYKFKNDGRAEKLKNFDPDYHGKKLDKIIDFSEFLLKDKFVTKLTKHYYQNYESIFPLLHKVSNRLNTGKIKPKYFSFIKFLHVWKKWNKILTESDKSLRDVLMTNLDGYDSMDKLYELWIFYKTLNLFKNLKQNESKHNQFTDGTYKIEYQYTKEIKWFLNPEDENKEIQRRPDIVIRKERDVLAIIEAKYMASHTKQDIHDIENETPGVPDRNIVNQMIIYMDYGKSTKEKSNLGIVLYADPRVGKTTLIKNSDNTKSIYFMNFHPNTSNDPNSSEELKKILSTRISNLKI